MNFYPFELPDNKNYPSKSDFEIIEKKTFGMGVYAKRPFKIGDLVARLSGYVQHHRTQHSLQITPNTHLNDIWFSGYFLHSSMPNVAVDMHELEVTALRDIEIGDAITMDYASTEDTLFKQFPAPNDPRIWICGRKEKISEEGLRYIAAFKKSQK